MIEYSEFTVHIRDIHLFFVTVSDADGWIIPNPLCIQHRNFSFCTVLLQNVHLLFHSLTYSCYFSRKKATCRRLATFLLQFCHLVFGHFVLQSISVLTGRQVLRRRSCFLAPAGLAMPLSSSPCPARTVPCANPWTSLSQKLCYVFSVVTAWAHAKPGLPRSCLAHLNTAESLF